MRDTPILTAEALGYAIRTRRLARKLSQAQLAELIGVERKWVVRLEKGNTSAEVGTVLRVVQTLGLEVLLRDPQRAHGVLVGKTSSSTLDEVFKGLRPGSKP